MTDASGALDGIRIPDFTHMMLGWPCTETCAGMGAVVLKIERPGKGERIGSMHVIGEFVGGESAAFRALKRKERSITIDLKHRDGRVPLLELAKARDVVTENFRTGVMGRLRLGHSNCTASYPKIIYASRSGRGAGSWKATQGMSGQGLLNRSFQAADRGPGSGRDWYRARNRGGGRYRGLSRCRADRA